MKNFTKHFSRNLISSFLLLTIVVCSSYRANAQAYCTPFGYYGDYYGYMHDNSFVTTGGITNINWAPGYTYPSTLAGTNSYDPSHTSNYYPNVTNAGYLYASTSMCVATPGTTISFTITTSGLSSSLPSYHGMWADWNQNGSFTDAGEALYNPSSFNSTNYQTLTGTFTVPLSAPTGLTRLRLAATYYGYGGIPTPCENYASNSEYYGCWIDFPFVVSGPCSGVPSALSFTSSPILVASCPGQFITISANETNYTTGLVTKWSSGPTATGPFTRIAGANSLNYTTSVADTTYFIIQDSCTNSFGVSPAPSAYLIPVQRFSIPYLETFNSTANATVPNCYVYNDNNGTNFIVQSGLHSADGTALSSCMYANDPSTNAAFGKNDFFTAPGLKLTTGNVYAIRFKYARGKSNPTANTGNTYPEHLQLFVNNYQPGFVVNNVTTGNKLFDQTINFDYLADTTVYFSPLTTAGYYFSWYSNTPHPSGGTSVTGGVVIVDSVYVGIGTCVAPAITAQPASATTGCVGSASTFTVATSGTGNNYQWQKNNTNIPGATNSTYTIASTALSDAGTYTCIITNPCGSQTSNGDVLTVNALPTASVTPASAATICSASGYTLTANTNASTAYYQWKLNGNNISGTGSTYVPTISGAYSVKVSDGNNCTQTSNSVAITVNQSPPATITPSGSTVFCTGDSVILFGPTGAGLSWQWYNGATLLPGATSSSYKATTSGNYIVKVQNANCTLNSSPQTVSVNNPPVATITASGPTTICQGNNVVLSGTSGAGYTYTWNLNGSPTTISSQNDTVSTAGNYTVTVAIGTCATTSAITTVGLNNAPSATITPNGTINICSNSSVVITAGAGNYTYQWQLNGTPNGITTQKDTVSAGGSYRVLVTDNSNNCSTLSSSVTINSIALPNSNITASATSICLGGSVTLNANLGTGLSYQWLKNGSAVAGAVGASYTDNPGLAPTPYYNLVVTDANGCFDTSAITTVQVNALPNATITPAGLTSFCPGGSVVLNANSGAGLTYTWQLNGTNIGGATLASYTASTGGGYTVTVTSTSTNCSAVSTTRTVTVNPNPVAQVSANGPTTFCPGNNVILTGLPSGVTYSYVWLNNGVSVGNFPTYTANNSGNFKVRVLNTSTGCFDTSSVVAISLFSAPNNIIAPQGPTTFCVGSSVVLNTAATAGYNYQWQLNNVSIGNATTSSYVASTAGNYTVVVSNATCSSTTPPVTITTNPLPTANITVVGATTFCSNQSVTLNANTGNGLTYQWTRGGVNVTGAGATAASYVTDTPGSYSVIVTNSNGCSNTASPSVNITVNPAPHVTITSPGSTTLCQGDTIHLFAYTGGVTGLTFHWQNNGANITGAIAQSYSVTAVGSNAYTVWAKSANGCYDTAAFVVATINPKPVPVVSLLGSNQLTTGNFISYHWYLNGNFITGASGQNYSPLQNGVYSVFVTDNNSCSAMSAGYNFTNTGVNGLSSANDLIKIYPNPATSFIHVEAPVKVNIMISTIEGREMLDLKDAKDVDITTLPNGIYMIYISDLSGINIKVEKLVKTGL